MLFRILVLAALVGAAPSGFATVETALDRLFNAMNIEKTQDDSIISMVDMQIQQNPKLGVIREEYIKFMRSTVGWKALQSKVRKLYAESFTENELMELASFYESAIGKKALVHLPRLMAEGMKIGQQAVQEKMPAFLKSVEPKLKKAAAEAGQ